MFTPLSRFGLGVLPGCGDCGQNPFFLAMDDITFRLPVPVGAILRLTSHVSFAQPCHHAVLVDVVAEVVDAKYGGFTHARTRVRDALADAAGHGGDGQNVGSARHKHFPFHVHLARDTGTDSAQDL